jgi:hypothetical protein
MNPASYDVLVYPCSYPSPIPPASSSECTDEQNRAETSNLPVEEGGGAVPITGYSVDALQQSESPLMSLLDRLRRPCDGRPVTVLSTGRGRLKFEDYDVGAQWADHESTWKGTLCRTLPKSYPIRSYPIPSYYITSYHIISYHITSHHIT